jgi:hypothetical protein
VRAVCVCACVCDCVFVSPAKSEPLRLRTDSVVSLCVCVFYVVVAGTVCPHLRPGDALLFDTRVLHFGLGNLPHAKKAHPAAATTDVFDDSSVGPDRDRALLYINYTQRWWDKNTDKNWGQQALYSDAEREQALRDLGVQVQVQRARKLDTPTEGGVEGKVPRHDGS